MNKAALVSMLVLLGCGKIESNGFTLGEVRTFSPLTIEASEKKRLAQICNSLKTKVQNLSINSSQNLSFNLQQKNCSEVSGLDDVPATLVEVSVEINPPNYKLRRTDTAQYFAYPDLETAESGLMKNVCSKLDELTSPLMLDGGVPIWIKTSNISAKDCGPKANEICLQVDYAVGVGSNKYEIKSREWLKFQLDPSLPYFGFFTERRTLSSSLCALNQASETKAVLKN
jgi:hypothetical protein